jgi:hypothetical protein
VSGDLAGGRDEAGAVVEQDVTLWLEVEDCRPGVRM